MSDSVLVSKDEYSQCLVPSVWRDTFYEVVEAFKEGDFTLARGVKGVLPISVKDARRISENIKDCGVRLISLPEETWATSLCQWEGKHWSVMIDLYTAEEGPSDLILHMQVFENDLDYIFEVHLVYVP